jgi:hypothetical protein
MNATELISGSVTATCLVVASFRLLSVRRGHGGAPNDDGTERARVIAAAILLLVACLLVGGIVIELASKA